MTETMKISHLWHATPLDMTQLETGKTYLALAYATGEDSGNITYYATTQSISLEEYVAICGFAEKNELLALIVEVVYQDGDTVQLQTHHTTEPFTLTQQLNTDGKDTRIVTRMGVN